MAGRSFPPLIETDPSRLPTLPLPAIMKFPCPHCQETLEALPQHEGAKADCALCGGKFIVPAPEHPATRIAGIDPAELLARGLQTVAPPDEGGWEPPEPEELSRLLPQYQITSILGRGGMGAVYKGRQERLGRNVAIKLLPAELADDEQFVARFEREARTLARLDHPGIIHVYDFGQTSDGHLYFVMEFIDGTDIHQMIHGPGLNPAQSLEIIGQVCDALQFAHSQGVVHRDIKPANILVNQAGRVKLADFGLARPMQSGISGQLTLTRVIMGTPDYMAPEQKRGEGDHRVDLYALGVMLYEMLCGRTPQGAWQPPSTRAHVDTRLDQVVIKAMQEEPERRYQQASEVKTDVDVIRTAILSSNAPLAPKHGRKADEGKDGSLKAPGSSFVPVEDFPQPSRWKRPLIEISIVVMLLVGAWYLVRSSKESGKDRGTGATPSELKQTSPGTSLPLKWEPLEVTDSGKAGRDLRPDSGGWIRFGGQVFPSVVKEFPAKGALRFILKWEGAAADNFLCQLKYNDPDASRSFKGVIKFRENSVSMNGATVDLAKVMKPGDEAEVIFAWDGTALAARVGGTAPMTRQSRFAAAPERIWFGFEDGRPGTEIMIRKVEWSGMEGVSINDALGRPSSGNSPVAPAARKVVPETPIKTARWMQAYGTDLPVRENGGIVRGPDGWITVVHGEVQPPLKLGPGSSGIRARIGWEEDKGVFQILTWIENKLIVSGVGETTGGSWLGDKGRNSPHPVPKKRGAEAVLQVAWIDGKHYTWIDGRLAGELEVSSQVGSVNTILKNGGNTPLRFRDVETVDLNGMGKDEAMSFLNQPKDISANSPEEAGR